MAFGNPIVGGTSLIRKAIKSPNYVPGSVGWIVNQDGTAEFNNLTVRGTFTGTDYVIDDKGVFFYGGTPAAGDMTGSWAPADGVDAYGNAYTAGLTLYSSLGNVFLGGLDGIIQSRGSSGSRITIEDGQISLAASPTDYGIALMLQNFGQGHGSLFVGSGADTISAAPVAFEMVTAAGSPTVGAQDTYPRTSTYAYFGGTAHHYVSGAVVKADATCTTGEVWHVVGATGQPAYGSNFAAGSTAGTYQGLQYRIDGMDNLHIEGAFHATAAVTSATVFTLPVGWRPKVARGRVTASDTSAGAMVNVGQMLLVNANGPVALHLSTACAIGQNFYIDATIPLGNLT